MPVFTEDIPNVVAIIETEEGICSSSNIICCDFGDVYMDMPVEIVFEDVTPDFTLPMFKPTVKVQATLAKRISQQFKLNNTVD